MTSSYNKVLVKYLADLETLLQGADLLELSCDLCNNIVLPKEASDKFASLDPDSKHLKREVKVRYLLKHVYERVREDENVYDRLIKVLSRLGGEVKALCGAMEREVDKATDSRASGGSVEDTQLVEQDVPCLVEILVSGSHLWEAIGIVLNLPKHKREDCGEGKENVNRLSNILTTWILGSYEGARPATLSSLREALASETLGLGKLAQQLITYKGLVTFLPITKKVCLNLEICYQSGDTEVTEDKSTLLEIRVSCSEGVSYQWSKDGEPLLDGADFSGVCSNILYINRASQCTEGKYSCCVSRGSKTVCSDEMSLSVIYPPEKKLLLEFYSLTEKEVPQISWPDINYPVFINLVLIKQKQKHMSTCDYYTIRGDMDDILESKEVAEYEEVFREYREGALVLVEGRPGSGKTTLVHKLTRDWASGKNVLQRAKLVFLVTLRLLNASGRDRSLLELLQICYGENFSKRIEHYLKESLGKGACFILDGLDEYPIESKKTSIINQLLFAQPFLPFSMVIVASRPIATEKLRKHCKMRVEVVGFSKDQIYSYVRSYPFNDCSPSMASKMIDYLDQHPNVLHMCYLPVHAAMICLLFSELEGDIPDRETQIYEQFTIATLLKHKDRKGEERRLRSLEELGGEEKKLFISICNLAFDMIVNSKQVVSKSDAKVSLSVDSTLDLLIVERTSEFHGIEDYYTFNHLTFQEFLAAYYLHKAEIRDVNLIEKKSLRNIWKFYSGLSKSDASITFLKKIITCNQFWSQISTYRLPYSYTARLAYESQQGELCDCLVKNEEVRLDGHISSADFIAQGYVISKTTKSFDKMVLVSSRFDFEGVELFVSVATDKKLQSIKSIDYVNAYSDENFKALNYLLLHLPFLEQLNMSEIYLRESKVECLTNEVTLPNLKVLKLSMPLVPPCSHPDRVLKQLTFNSKCIGQVFNNKTKSLIVYSVHENHKVHLVVWNKILRYVFGCQTSPMSWLHLYNIDNYPSLPHERLSHCTEVVLVNCCIGDEGAEILANTLNTAVLENLVLDFNRIRDSGAVALAGHLARCSVVQDVSIQCNCIGDSGATGLADALVHCSSLRRLDLQGNSLGDKGAVAIAKATESLPRLDLYLHNVNISEEGIERVLEYRARTRIRSMEFTSSWDSVSEGSIDTLKRALYCGYLPALKLSSSNISVVEELVTEQECVLNVSGIEFEDKVVNKKFAPTLCSIMNSLPRVRLITLERDLYSSSTIEQCLIDCWFGYKLLHSLTLDCGRTKLSNNILDAVRGCLQLRFLSLFGVDIDSYGVDQLFGDHKSWINLHTLKLVDCSLGSNDALVLSGILIHCKKLCCLDISDNGIGDIGALAIAKGLKDHTSLLELNMSDNIITSEGMTALSQMIKCNHLQHFNLSYNIIAEYMPILVVDVMCQDNLQTLELSGIGLGVDGISILSDGLNKCTQLVKLNISSNQIGSDCVPYLAEGLEYCINLQELNLGVNCIQFYGAIALCRIMRNCKYLRILNLGDNKYIGVDGVSLLVHEWKHKSMLTMNISECIEDHHQFALRKGEKCCSSCDCLQQLYSNNDYMHIPRIPKLVPPNSYEYR